MHFRYTFKFKSIFASIIFFFISIIIYINGQCPVNNNMAGCSGGRGAISSNTNLNGGDKYWWNNGSATVNNVNFNGGTLVICAGNLTINNGNLNGGTIIVMGGTINIDFNSNLSGTFTIINYSNINFNNGLNLQGNPAQIFNNGGNITVSGQTSLNNTSQIINNGTFETDNFLIQTNSGTIALCKGPASSTIINANFTNNSLNSIHSPNGPSCIYVGNDVTLNQSVTPHQNLNVCDSSGGNNSGAGGWGSATIITNCTDCSTVLPIQLIYFKANPENQFSVMLEWQTASEINNDYFTVERLSSQTHWEIISTITGGGYSNSILKYSTRDSMPLKGMSYYRLKQTDIDGLFSYSPVISVRLNNASKTKELTIYPNPTNHSILINGMNLEFSDIKIFDTLGKDVTHLTYILAKTKNTTNIDMSYLKSGLYLLKSANRFYTVYKI